MMNKEFLQNLKPGDTVLIEARYNTKKSTVDRVTKTQIIVDGTRFKRGTGQMLGSDRWYMVSLVEATPERIAKHIRQCKIDTCIGNIRYIHKSNLADLSDKAIDSISELLYEAKKLILEEAK